jgi:hypothetical protein
VDVCGSVEVVVCRQAGGATVLCCRLGFDAVLVCSPFELSCETFANWNIDGWCIRMLFCLRRSCLPFSILAVFCVLISTMAMETEDSRVASGV